MEIIELCIRRSRPYLYKLTGSGVNLTLSDCDTFIPASQLMHLAIHDEAISDQVSLDEPTSDQRVLNHGMNGNRGMTPTPTKTLEYPALR
jgi:hypothetical protein